MTNNTTQLLTAPTQTALTWPSQPRTAQSVEMYLIRVNNLKSE